MSIGTSKRDSFLSLKFLLFILFTAALVPVAVVGWRELYSSILERTPPEIEVLDSPRGIGLTPVTFRIRVTDALAGLKTIVVRSRQRDGGKELVKQDLDGRKVSEVAIDFPGEKSSLEEGTVELEVYACDQALWNNETSKSYSFQVDFQKPRVELLSIQSAMRLGGSQLVFYRAADSNLSVSGAKSATETFFGYPARGIDSNIQNPDVFAALLPSEPFGSPDRLPIRIFAEDTVGNAMSLGYDVTLEKRGARTIVVPVSDEFLNRVSELLDRNFNRLDVELRKSGQKLGFTSKKGTKERLLEKFDVVNTTLRRFNETQLLAALKGPRYDRYWTTPLVRQFGTLQSSFRDELRFTYQGQEIGSLIQNGYEITLPADKSEVVAAQAGIVIFSQTIGVLGSTVAIDHGLGMVSLYSHLENTNVNQGESVKAGQTIGFAGQTGFARAPQLHFELRIHGVPTDASEWWDANWFYSKITNRIDSVKQSLGIPVYKPLE